MAFTPDTTDAIQTAADTTGAPAAVLHRFAEIESGGDAKAKTGSYKGLLQLSDDEFAKYGPKGGDIYDAHDNALAAANKIAAENAAFAKTTGVVPDAAQAYVVHQQGVSGAAAHYANPTGTAWQNVRQYYPSDTVAKDAIWGNLGDDAKKQFGSVDNVTSADFTGYWGKKVSNGARPAETVSNGAFTAAPGAETVSTAPASLPPAPSPVPLGAFVQAAATAAPAPSPEPQQPAAPSLSDNILSAIHQHQQFTQQALARAHAMTPAQPGGLYSTAWLGGAPSTPAPIGAFDTGAVSNG